MRIRYYDKTMQTSLFFLGNSTYQPSGFAPAQRNRVDDGLIDVRILETGRSFSKIRVMTALLAGRLVRSRLYHEEHVPESSFSCVDGQPPLHSTARSMDSTSMQATASDTAPFRCFAVGRNANRGARVTAHWMTLDPTPTRVRERR